MSSIIQTYRVTPFTLSACIMKLEYLLGESPDSKKALCCRGPIYIAYETEPDNELGFRKYIYV